MHTELHSALHDEHSKWFFTDVLVFNAPNERTNEGRNVHLFPSSQSTFSARGRPSSSLNRSTGARSFPAPTKKVSRKKWMLFFVFSTGALVAANRLRLDKELTERETGWRREGVVCERQDAGSRHGGRKREHHSFQSLLRSNFGNECCNLVENRTTWFRSMLCFGLSKAPGQIMRTERKPRSLLN